MLPPLPIPHIPPPQQCKDLTTAKECWEKAATGHIAQRSNWHAAKAMERAGEVARDAKDWPEVGGCYRRAAELYLEEGRPAQAAEAVATAARALEDPDPTTATKLYAQAIEWVEDGGKEGLSADIYRSAIAHSIRASSWAEAVALLLRFAAACLNVNATNSLCKSYLGAVVVWLYAGNANAAWCTYQDALSVTEFSVSQEALAAEDMLNGYRAGDRTSIELVVSRQHCFTHLEPCVARLAKKLPTGGDDELHAMALVVGGSGGGGGGGEDGEEEDLT